MITRTKQFKPDVAQIVTSQIMEALEQGVIPWQKPWKTHLPMNIVSGRQYHGVNLLILSLSLNIITSIIDKRGTNSLLN